MRVQPQLKSAQYFSEVVNLFSELETQQNLQINSYSKQFLDSVFPLEHGSHKNVKSYVVYYRHVLAFLDDGTQSGLLHPEQFVALCGHKENPESLLLKNDDVHVEIRFNPCGAFGRNDMANVEDIQVEEKISETKRQWFSLVKNEGRFNIAKEFTHKNGDDYILA